MNILLTSAGRRAYIVEYFKQCQGIGKVFASNSVYTIALKKADGYLLSPLIYDSDYIPSIIKFCKSNDIKAIISLFDIDLLILARNKEIFETNGIKLILAPASFVEICNDKWKTYNYLLSLGLKSPKTYLHIDNILSAIAKNEIQYPIIIKPRWGMASMGIYKAEDENELKVLSKKCNCDIFDSYLKYESSTTIENPIIYQEIMHGEEYGLDIINDLNGKYIGTFAKQKIEMRSGETDFGRTVASSPFEGIARIIAEHSKHEGILSVDCFKNDNGIFITEMNCRISGHYPLSYLAGMNYPQQLIDWLNNKPTNPKLLKFKTDLYIIKDLIPTILYEKNANGPIL